MDTLLQLIAFTAATTPLQQLICYGSSSATVNSITATMLAARNSSNYLGYRTGIGWLWYRSQHDSGGFCFPCYDGYYPSYYGILHTIAASRNITNVIALIDICLQELYYCLNLQYRKSLGEISTQFDSLVPSSSDDHNFRQKNFLSYILLYA